MDKFNGIPENSLVILDTSGMHGDAGKNILTDLRDGWGVEYLSSSFIREESRALDSVLSMGRELVVISEVQEEIRSYLENLNFHVKFQRDIPTRSGKKLARRKRIKINEHVENRDYEKLEELEKYTNSLYRFLNRLKDEDPINSLNKTEFRIFENYLRTANALNYLDDGVNYSDRKLTLGDSLGTDRKVVAAAYTFSHNVPTTILTMDKGLIKLAEDVGVMSERRKYKKGENEVYAFNPSSNSYRGIQVIWPPSNSRVLNLEGKILQS